MPENPFTIAIVGAGPSGIYAAEALSHSDDVPIRVAVLDRLPVPFGLVRYGVAPDHPSIRSIRNTLERTLDSPGVTFYGNVRVGEHLSLTELRGAVDAVIYAFGAATDRRLEIPGEDLPGSLAAQEFVAWYCGHPDVHPDTQTATNRTLSAVELMAQARAAVVVGVGNVALDVTRVLIKTADELDQTDMADEVLAALSQKTITDVHLVGRRGPAHTTFTTKELRELGKLPGVDVLVDPADLELSAAEEEIVAGDRVAARNVTVLREWSERPRTGAERRIHLHFWTRPVAIEGDDRVRTVRLERTALHDGGLVSAGGESTLAAQLVVRSIGYQGVELAGLPFDATTGRVPHAEGRVRRDGGFSPDEYVTGWIKRGPTGVIGTNKSDAVETVTSLLADIRDGDVTQRSAPGALDTLLAARGVEVLDMPAWHRIDAAEVELGQLQGRERSTLAHHSELLAAADEEPAE